MLLAYILLQSVCKKPEKSMYLLHNNHKFPVAANLANGTLIS
jgi:hypothetical protein